MTARSSPPSAPTPPSSSLVARLRAPRVAGTAVFDWVGSLALAAVVGRWVVGLRREPVAWTLWIAFWVLLGVFVHRAAGVDTPVAGWLGVRPRT